MVLGLFGYYPWHYGAWDFFLDLGLETLACLRDFVTLYSIPLLAWGYCVSLYLWNTTYYTGTAIVFGMFDIPCRIYTWYCEYYTLPMGICSYLIISLLTSLWRNFWLDSSTDASLLEVLWVSFYSCSVATDSFPFGIALSSFFHFHFA